MTAAGNTQSTYLYLIRHGATAANLQRPHVLQGKGIDLPLSELGRTQAAALGRFLSPVALERVYTSPLRRAVETARAVADWQNLDIAERPELVEADVGAWEGLDWDRILREHPEAYARFMEDPGRNPYLGGESYGDVQRRVQPVFCELLKEHYGQRIAVVAHNVVNRVYLAGLLRLDLKFAKGIPQTNTGINVIRRRRGETQLLTLNAHFHLNGLAAS